MRSLLSTSRSPAASTDCASRLSPTVTCTSAMQRPCLSTSAPQKPTEATATCVSMTPTPRLRSRSTSMPSSITSGGWDTHHSPSPTPRTTLTISLTSPASSSDAIRPTCAFFPQNVSPRSVMRSRTITTRLHRTRTWLSLRRKPSMKAGTCAHRRRTSNSFSRCAMDVSQRVRRHCGSRVTSCPRTQTCGTTWHTASCTKSTTAPETSGASTRLTTTPTALWTPSRTSRIRSAPSSLRPVRHPTPPTIGSSTL
mmetsp:Transcript_16345/g.31745  ORF Transcript_16345/g.31745 Transcript_16345/m.31745 type:complete len:253 (-) Transcript_16345:1229-1987(-)